MTLRRLAEHFSRGVVLRRRLPARFGNLPIYVTPEAGLRYWLAMSRVDSVLYSMAEELVKPNSVVWDVGANVGLFTLCAAATAGPSGFVLSIEPDTWLAHLITRSRQEIARYACSDVKVLCASISDSNGVSSLEIAERARASNHLVETAGSTQARGVRCIQPTVTLTLDFLLNYFPAPSVLKIDVETHEVNVLKGAARLLREVRPTIWCEVSHENSIEITSLLHAAGYQLYGAEIRPHPLTERAWFHTLAVPRDSVLSDAPDLHDHCSGPAMGDGESHGSGLGCMPKRTPSFGDSNR
jgi:FkbM family methyltransferase